MWPWDLVRRESGGVCVYRLRGSHLEVVSSSKKQSGHLDVVSSTGLLTWFVTYWMSVPVIAIVEFLKHRSSHKLPAKWMELPVSLHRYLNIKGPRWSALLHFNCVSHKIFVMLGLIPHRIAHNGCAPLHSHKRCQYVCGGIKDLMAWWCTGLWNGRLIFLSLWLNLQRKQLRSEECSSDG